MRVTLDTSRLHGPYDGYVELALNDPARPGVRFIVEGRVVPPVEVSPRAAFFVAARRGEPREATLEVVNHEAEPLRIESVARSSSGPRAGARPC
ncbi:MAG TPA: hypothetical protein VNN07_15280 [Candidatus Tectomicrobia bacterium]|nr:hypothetical protein [Candidatus Tectomicrobia bacterium]